MLADWGDVPGVTINRFCASGIDAVAHAAARVRAQDLELIAAGGVESVSRVPMFSDGGPLFCDPATVTKVGSVFMGISADLVATMEGYRATSSTPTAWRRRSRRRAPGPTASSAARWCQ